VGRTADLAGQNYKKSVYPFEIEYCTILGAADYEFGVSLMKFKIRLRTQNGGPFLKKIET
jgi:hypothetical protein